MIAWGCYYWNRAIDPIRALMPIPPFRIPIVIVDKIARMEGKGSPGCGAPLAYLDEHFDKIYARLNACEERIDVPETADKSYLQVSQTGRANNQN